MTNRIFASLVFALAFAFPSIGIAQSCTQNVNIYGYCKSCDGALSYHIVNYIYFQCEYCGTTCLIPSNDPSPEPMVAACGDPEAVKVLLAKRVQYVVDVDLTTLYRIAEINPIAATFLAMQTANLSSIAKGDAKGEPVNIEDGHFFNPRLATMDTVRLLMTGVTDPTVIANSFTPAGEGLVVYAQYKSSMMADGSVQLRFESLLRNTTQPAIDEPLYSPLVFRLGPVSRELDVATPGRGGEKLKAYRLTQWAARETVPQPFRLRE